MANALRAGEGLGPAPRAEPPGHAPDSYRLAVEPPLPVARGGEAAGLARAVAVRERYVRDHSEQWFNSFDVWDSPAGRVPEPAAGRPLGVRGAS
jgi:hypothetical protein